MAKTELKTKVTEVTVADFIADIDDLLLREGALEIDEMMAGITGEKGKMWGATIVGYGHCYLKYASGRELDWMLTGFSPRKQNFTIYIMDGFTRYDELLGKLGKYKTGKSCLYIKRLSDIDTSVLRELMQESVAYMQGRGPQINQ